AAPAHAQGGAGCPWPGAPGGPIVLDGQFDDWPGRACIADPPGDCGNERLDTIALFNATNPDDPTAYFMVQTLEGATQPLGLRLMIDTNDDGVYTSAVDRRVEVRYQPQANDSSVDVALYDGAGAFLGTIASDADWGESLDEGGRRVEWGVSFAQLGITAGQAIRFRLESRGGNTPGSNACDATDEVQWSPADALGLALLALALGAGAVVAARRRRRLA
ncbi:MAG TPA: hypothetical protein VNL77_08105, partial [Roseiflexaceae bacterium]|nr:hypothetical protein [Roseiflexaceae bacterium]